MADVRAAFIAAAGDYLRLQHASLVYQGKRQVLRVTGWFVSGKPFVEVSAAFDGDPVARAAQFARDLVATHFGPQPDAPATLASLTEGNDMSAPQPIKDLGDMLNEHLKPAIERAKAFAGTFKTSVENLHVQLDLADAAKKGIDEAAKQIQQALGMSNGSDAQKTDTAADVKVEAKTGA